jgi:hypothetical protein
MRSRLPAAAVPETHNDNPRREPSLARQAPASVARFGPDSGPAAKPLRAGERVTVLSSTDEPAPSREGMGVLAKLGLAVVCVLALVGVFSIVRYFAGL